MIFPTASEVLRCIDQTLLEASDAGMPRMAVKSALATSRHLIRHVELRLQLEPSILRDDTARTTALLDKVAAYFDGVSDTEMAERIRTTLGTTPALSEETGDDLEGLRRHALALREQVYAALAALQKRDGNVKTCEDYLEIRRLIREYIAYELAQENRLIQPAFAGQGPRR